MIDRISYLKALIDEDPQDPFLPYALGLEYFKIGKNEEADTILRSVIDRFPDYLPAYYHLAQLNISMENPGDAFTFIEQGKELALKQRNMKTFNELNNLLLDPGESDPA